MTSTLAIYMLGLTLSSGAFTAAVAYAIWWGEQPDGEPNDAAIPAEIVVDGQSVDLAAVWFGTNHDFDVYELLPLGDGRRRLAVRDDPRAGQERPVVRVSVPRRAAVYA